VKLKYFSIIEHGALNIPLLISSIWTWSGNKQQSIIN